MRERVRLWSPVRAFRRRLTAGGGSPRHQRRGRRSRRSPCWSYSLINLPTMVDFTSHICPRCGMLIGNRVFVRDRLDDPPEHLDCHRRARGEAAATDAALPERRPRQPAGSDISTEFSLRDRFLTELAYYEADKPFLTVEKSAQRCRLLSMLLTAIFRGNVFPHFHQPPNRRPQALPSSHQRRRDPPPSDLTTSQSRV